MGRLPPAPAAPHSPLPPPPPYRLQCVARSPPPPDTPAHEAQGIGPSGLGLGPVPCPEGCTAAVARPNAPCGAPQDQKSTADMPNRRADKSRVEIKFRLPEFGTRVTPIFRVCLICLCRGQSQEGEGGGDNQHSIHWAPRTRQRHHNEHGPQRPAQRSDPTQHAKGRTGDCAGPRKETATRRNVTQGGGDHGIAPDCRGHRANDGYRSP